MAKKPKKELTPKDLGLVDGVKLSKSYANSKTHFKTVTDVVIGFYVVGDGRRSPVRVAPLFRADVWLRPRKGEHAIISSYEIGEYFNPWDDREPDNDGDAFAYQASIALGSLQRHAEWRKNYKKYLAKIEKIIVGLEKAKAKKRKT